MDDCLLSALNAVSMPGTPGSERRVLPNCFEVRLCLLSLKKIIINTHQFHT